MLDTRFEEILRSVAELPSALKLSREQNLRSDLGIDSLTLMDLMVHLEAEYGVEFDDDALATINTVDELWLEVDRVD
ncbi:acyl carrier protein [Streptomyces antimycoticus]|uniref:acyl carrier protein n=1 Tax=Streptomyces antimycoticus TaxID=68175 RepID=UPI0036922DC6